MDERGMRGEGRTSSEAQPVDIFSSFPHDGTSSLQTGFMLMPSNFRGREQFGFLKMLPLLGQLCNSRR